MNPSPPTDATTPGVALRYPAFRWYLASRLFGMIGFQMQGVAVGWQIYDLTRSPLHLGAVGLAQFVPAFALTLVAGDAADRFERKRLLGACHLAGAICTGALWLLARQPEPRLWAIYGVLFVIGAVRAFSGPAGSALAPNLVEERHFPNAVAWSSTVWHVAVVLGPALGGAAYAIAGRAQEVYGIAAILIGAAAVAVLCIRATSRSKATEPRSWRTLLAGLRYVRERPLLLGALSLDMVAVLLGGAVALLPIYARDILHVGPTGLGLLRSAPAGGATLMAIFLAYRPLERRAGTTLFVAVGVFGLATIAFGLSRSFVVSLIALLVAGGADMVSVFVRHMLVQLNTPDSMRGRVSAVNLAFIGVSNELGEFESGLLAAWLGTMPAVVFGGAATCMVALAWSRLFPALRQVDALRKAPE
jgi:MFS family permease